MKSRSNTIIGAGVAVAIVGAGLVFVYARSLQGAAGAAPGTSAAAFVAAAPIAATLSHVWAVGQYGTGNYTSPGPTRTLIEEACQ